MTGDQVCLFTAAFFKSEGSTEGAFAFFEAFFFFIMSASGGAITERRLSSTTLRLATTPKRASALAEADIGSLQLGGGDNAGTALPKVRAWGHACDAPLIWIAWWP